MRIVNLCPHALDVQIENGERVTIPPSGTVARVSMSAGPEIFHIAYGPESGIGGDIPLHAASVYGEITGLPEEPEAGTIYVVSQMVASRCIGRPDVFHPGTGPGDGVIRKLDGTIDAITRLVQAPRS